MAPLSLSLALPEKGVVHTRYFAVHIHISEMPHSATYGAVIVRCPIETSTKEHCDTIATTRPHEDSEEDDETNDEEEAECTKIVRSSAVAAAICTAPAQFARLLRPQDARFPSDQRSLADGDFLSD